MLNELKTVINETKIETNVPMSELTTFKTGGNADMVIYPTTSAELKSVVEFLFDCKKQYYILGNGSNLLVSDDGIKKPIICLGKNFASIDVFDNCITAKSGAFLSAIARKAYEESLTGFEFAAGIPGTLGGALMMNAGAYGGEMKDVVEAVSFMDSTGQEYVVSGEEMEFSYRKSALSDTDCIITGATIKLSHGDKNVINEKMADLAARRRDKQPLEFPSAGSTFKRPVGYFAGALIEDCNLKGVSVGGAQVSEKHAGFIINKDNATTNDILNLIDLVRNTVYEKHGVFLETEVKYWD
ncbi:MAG: UDP-N-acetylmuramate dehydrogenase [Ruminococcaceae bacterium]|nr:UDP-N-acetylmuramate dehydrogenase [Oscillospiraceae bacterium]